MAQAVTIKAKTAALGFTMLSLSRLGLGIIFLWAFIDKLWGLGFATCRDAATGTVTIGCSRAWSEGGSPTKGFLTNATQGPFAEWFQAIAGLAWVDWLFMVGLLGIGVGLISGVFIRLSAISASVMLLLMWLAALWPANNPVVDDHIVYIFVLMAIAAFARYQKFSLAKQWQNLPVVRKLPWMS